MDQLNYPKPNQPASVPATPGTQNPGQAKTEGYMDSRGKAASTGGLNYSGGPGDGCMTPKNQPKAP